MDKRGYKHGLRYTPEYRAWLNMRARCVYRCQDQKYYEHINVCSEWNDPVRFIEDMGKRPSDLYEIDRIDNTKDYSKENCRWVEKTPQMRNTRISKWWFVNGVRYASLTEAASVFNVTINTIKKWCDGRTGGGYTYPPKPNCWSEKKYG